jgi:hypothetical protein
MTPFWIGLLKRAMPVVIEAGSSIYKRRAAAKQAPQAQSVPLDFQSEKLEALQVAIIRVATEVESLSRKQVELAQVVTHLRWVLVAALILSTLAIVIVLAKYL